MHVGSLINVPSFAGPKKHLHVVFLITSLEVKKKKNSVS